MSIVDVSRYLLLFAGNFHPQEDDGEPPPIQHFFLSLGQKVEEGIGKSFGGGGGKRLGFIFGETEFGLFNSFLFGDELIPGQNLGFGVITLNKRTGTSSLSWRASSISPRYMRSSLVMWESRYSSYVLKGSREWS